MKILIIYATVEGQTGKIAQTIADQVRAAGHAVDLVDASDKTTTVSFKGVDKTILAAPVHERRHPKWFEMLLAAQLQNLEAQDTLFLSVSLMAAFEDTRDEAREFVTEMKMRTGFTPKSEALVAGAVRISSYDYFATQVLRHVVLRGHEHGLDDGDHEFTDWDALQKTVSDFLER